MIPQNKSKINDFFAHLASLAVGIDLIRMQDQLIVSSNRQIDTFERSKQRIQQKQRLNAQLFQLIKQGETKYNTEIEKNNKQISDLMARSKKATQAEKELKIQKVECQKQITKLKGAIQYGGKHENYQIKSVQEGQIDLKNNQIRDLQLKINHIEETCLILEGQIEVAIEKKADNVKLKKDLDDSKKDIKTLTQNIEIEKANLAKLEQKLIELEQKMLALDLKITELHYQAEDSRQKASNLEDHNSNLQYEWNKSQEKAQLQRQQLSKQLLNVNKIIQEETKVLDQQEQQLKKLKSNNEKQTQLFKAKWQKLKSQLSKEETQVVQEKFNKLWKTIDPTFNY